MIVDIIVLLFLFGSIAVAFLRGFIREVLTIIGIVGGAAAAYVLGPLVATYMRGWLGVTDAEEPQKLFDVIPYEFIADGLSYGLVFITFVIIISIFSHAFAEFVKSLGLGIIDRTLGILFGFFRGVLVLGLLYLPVSFLDDATKERWFEGSQTHGYLELTAQLILNALPQEWVEQTEEKLENVNTEETRKRLEELNVLNKESSDSQEGAENPGKIDGYTDEFRDRMDNLFEKKNDTNPEYSE
ncbi:MAG: hypothetical protein GC137_01090 [Alphaproteobacteria bacterium]|nr:hypothetical protein [Alphaproteobacteria bacterium]